MKLPGPLVRPVARVMLRPARAMWRVLPSPVRKRLAPRVSRLQLALQLGTALRSRNGPSVRGAHRLVPLSPPHSALPPGIGVKRTPVPHVSIIVPVHDDGPFLATCLRSIIDQGFEAWECVVVDDCSLDDSRAIASRYAELDDRIRVVRHDRNLGLAATRNTGISRALGEYTTFLDADDFLFQDSLAIRHSVAVSADDPSTIGSWCDWVAVPEVAGLGFLVPPGQKSGTVDYTTGGGNNQFISTSPMLRTDVVRSLGGFDDTFRTAEDFEFWTRLLRNGFRLVGTGTVGVAYRQKRVSMISADPLGHARNAATVFEYMSRPLEPGAISSMAAQPFIEPIQGIPERGALAKRLVTFLVYAMLTGDQEQTMGVLGLIGSTDLSGIDLDDVITRALARHAIRIGGMSVAEREAVAQEVRSNLQSPAGVGPRSEGVEHAGIANLERVVAAVSRPRPGAGVSRFREARVMPTYHSWDVVLHGATPSAAADLLVLGRELVDLGHSVALLDPGGGSDSRVLAHSEGIRVVTSPCGPARLQISSDGRDRSIRTDRHLVVSAEPWIQISDAPWPVGEIDLALGRWSWELDLWRGRGVEARMGGWLSRASRHETLGRPHDGGLYRRHGSSVVVLRSPSDNDGPGCKPIVDVLGSGYDVVFGDRCNAPADSLLPAHRFPVVAASVRAVVVIGAEVPVDAVMSGTPVLAITGQSLMAMPGVRRVALPELVAALAWAEPIDFRNEDDDWLMLQLEAAVAFLD
jgi:hypothetical protein